MRMPAEDMKYSRLTIICLIVAASLSADLCAESLSTSASSAQPGFKMKKIIHQLVREDVEKRSFPRSETTVDMPPETDGVIVLERLIVQDQKPLPEFTAPRETELAKLLRTGTIKQYVGKRTTVRLWSSGDAGIVLSFRR